MEKSILAVLSGFSVRRFVALLCVAVWTFSACGETSAKWFRLILKQKLAWSSSSKGSIKLGQWALFDADGNQLGIGLEATDPTTVPSQMAPGTCLVSTPYTATAANVARLFDGKPAGDWLTISGLPTQSKEPYCLISVTNSATWSAVVVRLPESSKPVSSHLLYTGAQNWSGSEATVVRWTVEASFDGETWFVVHDQSASDAKYPSKISSPYNGGVPYVLSVQKLHVVSVDSAETNAFEAAYANDVLVEKTGAGTVTTTSGFDRAFLHVADGTLAVSPEGSATAVLAGVTTVSNGATLAMSGAVEASKLVNDGTVSLSSGATLLASASDGVTNYLYGGGISGAGGIEVSGGGVVEMTGANAYAGDTLVSSGTLRLGRGATTPAKWFRIIFKSKYAVNSNPDKLSLNEFAMYDDVANQVNIGLKAVASAVPARLMGAGTCKVDLGSDTFTSSGVANLFDGVTGTDSGSPRFAVYNLPTSGGLPAMSANKPDTWVMVTLRLADDAAPPACYNIYLGYANWSGTEMAPNGWTVQASCNGEDWFNVDNRSNLPYSSAGDHNSWYNGGVPFAFSAPAFDAANAIPAASILEVASGAAVESVGGAASVSRLRIDCAAGAGMLSGVSFASGGALYLTNASGYEYGATLPLAVLDAADVANLTTWKVYREGAEISGAKFKIKDGQPTVDCTGFLLLIK